MRKKPWIVKRFYQRSETDHLAGPPLHVAAMLAIAVTTPAVTRRTHRRVPCRRDRSHRLPGHRMRPALRRPSLNVAAMLAIAVRRPLAWTPCHAPALRRPSLNVAAMASIAATFNGDSGQHQVVGRAL